MKLYTQEQEWEQQTTYSLIAWQTALQKLKTNKTSQTILQERELQTHFFDILVAAPISYHFLSLSLVFTPSDLRHLELAGRLEQLHAVVEHEPQKSTYTLYIITPRRHDWNRSGFDTERIAHRGSYVREHKAEYPDLETMVYNLGWRDHVTKQQGMILLKPQANDFRERLYVYPRNLTKIKVTKTPPLYLTPDELAGVEQWYIRENSQK